MVNKLLDTMFGINTPDAFFRLFVIEPVIFVIIAFIVALLSKKAWLGFATILLLNILDNIFQIHLTQDGFKLIEGLGFNITNLISTKIITTWIPLNEFGILKPILAHLGAFVHNIFPMFYEFLFLGLIFATPIAKKTQIA